MRAEIRGGGAGIGGAIGYHSERLLEEVAYIAYHFHWGYDQLLDLDHLERRAWVREVEKIIRRINSAEQEDVE